MEINTNISPEILSAKQNYSIVGNSPDLIAAIGQSLEEVILVVLVGVVLAIVIVIQRCWAEEGLRERFGKGVFPENHSQQQRPKAQQQIHRRELRCNP